MLKKNRVSKNLCRYIIKHEIYKYVQNLLHQISYANWKSPCTSQHFGFNLKIKEKIYANNENVAKQFWTMYKFAWI